jgi:hypothetical protein
LDYEESVSTGAQAKISIGSFLPFSTVSVNRVISGTDWDCRFTPSSDQTAALRQAPLGPDLPIGAW